MTDYEITIDDLKSQILQCEAQIEFGEAIKRLENNPDFVKVVCIDFFEKLPVRLTDLYSDSTIQPSVKEKVQEDLQKVGYFKKYLTNSKIEAEYAATVRTQAIDAITEYEVEENA